MYTFETTSKEMWIGNTDSYNLKKVSNRTSSTFLYVSFFDFEGKLYEAAFDTNQPVLSNNEYKLENLLSNNSCNIKNYYFRYSISESPFLLVSNISKITTQDSNIIQSISLPANLYLDYKKSFMFEVYITLLDWSQYLNHAVNFQFSNASIVDLQYDRFDDHIRQAIVYSVIVTDKGIDRDVETEFLATTFKMKITGETLDCFGKQQVLLINIRYLKSLLHYFPNVLPKQK
jgi:hypothetical protein